MKYVKGGLTIEIEEQGEERYMDYQIVLWKDGRSMPISETACRGDPIEALRRFVGRDYISNRFDGVIK